MTAPVARRWWEGKTPAQVVHYDIGRVKTACGELLGRGLGDTKVRADVTCMACLRASDPPPVKGAELVR